MHGVLDPAGCVYVYAVNDSSRVSRAANNIFFFEGALPYTQREVVKYGICACTLTAAATAASIEGGQVAAVDPRRGRARLDGDR